MPPALDSTSAVNASYPVLFVIAVLLLLAVLGVARLVFVKRSGRN